MRKPTWLWAPVACLLLVACSPASRNTPAPDQPAVPKRGGTLTLRENADAFNWDISQSTSAPNLVHVMLAYDRLLDWKTGPDVAYNSNELDPGLAERWEVSPDAKSFTFHLRKGAKFAPAAGSGNKVAGLNGREVTAADVKWTFEYYTRTGESANKNLPRSELLNLLPDFDRADVVDPYTAVLRFKKPFVPFPNYTAAERMVILPRELADKEGGFKDNILGSGPLQLDQATSLKGSQWLFKRNPDYFQTGQPYIDQLRSHIPPEEATVNAAFAARQIDVLTVNVDRHSAEDIRRLAPDAVLYEYETNFPWSPYMNQRVKPFNDERARRAFSMGLDRQEMVNLINGGRGRPQMPTVFNDYFTKEEVAQLQPYNPDEARRLMAEAGYANGADVEVPVQGLLQGQEYVTLIQLMQAQLKKVGFNLNIKNVDTQTFTAILRSDTFQFQLQTGQNFRWDIDTSLAYYYPGSSNNYTATNDPELTRLVEAQRAETVPAKRKDLVRTAAKLIASKAYDFGLFSRIRYELWQPWVKDYYPHWNLTRPIPFRVWLDR